MHRYANTLLKWKLRLFSIGLVILAITENCLSQSISIGGGNVVLNITTGLPGQEPTPVTNQSTTLTYRRGIFITRKVTVQSNCPGQDFTLKVVAINVTSGTAAPEVTLTTGMPAADFITNIPPSFFFQNATCMLRYTASATFANGNSAEMGNDVHTITYTLLNQ